jgi:phosphatidylglycerol:prolipoprotein diacylglycerol transferase
MTPPVDPILFQLGPLAVRWYGLLIMLGVLSACYVASRYVARQGENPDNIWDMLLWVLIPGLLGARLYYVFIQSPRGPEGLGSYLENPLQIFAVWQGGIHIFGGFLVGGLALYLYLRIKKLPPLIYLDGIALGLPLGQAIGRQANFINQELYGPPTDLPWGLIIEPARRIDPYRDLMLYPPDTLFHPLFLYESLWNFTGFLLLFWLAWRFTDWLRSGDIFLLYLIWYPLGRFFIEFLRTDSWFFPGTVFNVVHMLSFLAFTTAVVLLVVRHRRAPALEQEPPTSGSQEEQHKDSDDAKGRTNERTKTA